MKIASLTRRLSAGVAAAMIVTVAQGNACRGVDFPNQVQVGGVDLKLNGLGVRKATFLKINVYVAALYVTHVSRDAKTLLDSAGPQELILQFVRAVGVDDLRKAWREGFARVTHEQSAPFETRIATLNSWMADVKTGEQLRFVRQPHAGVQVSAGGITKGTIEGDDFSQAFLAIWLGSTPPNEELKTGLLGGACD